MKPLHGKTGAALVAGLVLVMALVPACGSSSPTTTTTPPVTTTSSMTSATTTSSTTPATTTTTSTSPTATPTTTTATTTTTTTTASPTTTTPAATPPTTTTATTTTTTTEAATFQTLAASGKTVYTTYCLQCHGASGGGSQVCPVTIWGQGAELGLYNGVTLFTDASGMLNYVSKRMPLTAPGTLTHTQYIGALAYIMVQAGLADPAATFDENNLASIPIP